MNKIILFLASLAIIFTLASPALANGIPIQIDPMNIAMGTFYNGETIEISGEVPAASELVLRFVGARNELHMKTKGKALGLLWMNLGSASFDETPNVFIVSSSKTLETLSAEGNPEALSIGLKGLANEIVVSSEEQDSQSLIQELIKLKKHEKLYVERTGEIVFGETVNGATPFEAKFRLPARLSPGQYELQAFALKDGVIQGQTSTTIEAGLVSLPKLIAGLAFNHGALFGILATIVALLGGMIIGYIFRGASGGH